MTPPSDLVIGGSQCRAMVMVVLELVGQQGGLLLSFMVVVPLPPSPSDAPGNTSPHGLGQQDSMGVIIAISSHSTLCTTEHGD